MPVCATPSVDPRPAPPVSNAAGADEDLSAFAHTIPDGLAADFLVEGMNCGGCVARIERVLSTQPGIRKARANLASRRLHVEWRGPERQVNEIAEAVRRLGFGLVPSEVENRKPRERREERELLIAMAVAGFAAANVMLLSVSLWAGHGGEMSAATRDLLHWFSALVALPAIIYAGRPFFRSAIRALAGGNLNMDVPISLAVGLAAAVSLWETIRSGQHVWFDSAITLLFFLLLGRFLERRARGRARAAAERIFSLQGASVTVVEDGRARMLRPDSVWPGATVLVAAGERISVDGEVLSGTSEIDRSLLTGESVPETTRPGGRVFAGTVNLLAPLQIRATAAGRNTVLAEVSRLMEQAEARRGRFVSMADRAATLYAPIVHLLAAGTFLGWWLIGGASGHEAMLYAIAVLIITCPCAMGLAVPAVQVAAIDTLMRHGTLVKSGDLLERLSQIDTVVFDKTGTLTEGRPVLLNPGEVTDADLSFAAAMAASSKHPLARALSVLRPDIAPLDGVQEVPGAGLVVQTDSGEARLGKRGWAATAASDDAVSAMEFWLSRPQRAPVRFRFGDQVRADAAETVADLKGRGLEVILLSGDRRQVAENLGRALGIGQVLSEKSPAEKCAFLTDLDARGRRVLMVGDGLNDAPALATAHASLSPTTAADISQTAADAVFQGTHLAPVTDLLTVAHQSNNLMRQNMALSFLYNAATVPLAMAGFVTPLVAAVCMSGSSLAVVGNALRIRLGR